MIPSRPKGVLNQGIPAYGYGPWDVSVMSMYRSETERLTISLYTEFELSTLAARALDSCKA